MVAPGGQPRAVLLYFLVGLVLVNVSLLGRSTRTVATRQAGLQVQSLIYYPGGRERGSMQLDMVLVEPRAPSLDLKAAGRALREKGVLVGISGLIKRRGQGSLELAHGLLCHPATMDTVQTGALTATGLPVLQQSQGILGRKQIPSPHPGEAISDSLWWDLETDPSLHPGSL